MTEIESIIRDFTEQIELLELKERVEVALLIYILTKELLKRVPATELGPIPLPFSDYHLSIVFEFLMKRTKDVGFNSLKPSV